MASEASVGRLGRVLLGERVSAEGRDKLVALLREDPAVAPDGLRLLTAMYEAFAIDAISSADLDAWWLEQTGHSFDEADDAAIHAATLAAAEWVEAKLDEVIAARRASA